MPVRIGLGKHTATVARGTEEIVCSKLEEAGHPLHFDWILHPVTKVKGTPHTPRFKAVKCSEHRRSVLLRIQPGNSDTAWKCELIVPGGISPQELLERLRPLVEHRGRKARKTG